ncbi:hypothetical protein COOONC_13422 [Cooperia oncophora]
MDRNRNATAIPDSQGQCVRLSTKTNAWTNHATGWLIAKTLLDPMNVPASQDFMAMAINVLILMSVQ